jgi:hypothetical protein
MLVFCLEEKSKGKRANNGRLRELLNKTKSICKAENLCILAFSKKTLLLNVQYENIRHDNNYIESDNARNSCDLYSPPLRIRTGTI